MDELEELRKEKARLENEEQVKKDFEKRDQEKS